MLILKRSRVAEVLMKKPSEEGKELKEYKMSDIKARNVMTQCLVDIVLEFVMHKTTAKELMDTLHFTNIKMGFSQQIDFQRKLRNSKFKRIHRL
ncbi:hypothetical protein PR048_012742 [Dryococelus australis]|uniref:Uncharacterized protein n=1 Tax=Dryococelus australis TaxID=614101 RepID=A0ABQ9HQ94_9NEOP|nr:hypothetical protein PR048_012742 [Dryococelus australis]